MSREEPQERKVVARNKKAGWKFEILEKFEAGLVLLGTEVKSLRDGRVALADSYARFRGDELYLMNCHISPYERAGHVNHEPMRPRKLLLRRRELRRLKTKIEERGLTVVPLSIYFRRGIAKTELGLARGKARHDKRQDVKRRDAEREIRRAERR
jgi:SsrA-binding protein